MARHLGKAALTVRNQGRAMEESGAATLLAMPHALMQQWAMSAHVGGTCGNVSYDAV